MGSSNQTSFVRVLSYAGQLNLTAVADHEGCPDLDVFAQGRTELPPEAIGGAMRVPCPRKVRTPT